MKFEKISIKELIPATYNPRKDLKPSDKEYQKIKNSIQEFGYVEPIIVNTDNTIIGGHQRVKILKDLGYNEIDVIKIDIDKTKEKALNIALNKITGEWDYTRLSEVLEELKLEDFDLDITGFELDELDDILEVEKEVVEDDYEIELPEEPKAKLGDIYQLGNHRLMCGDSKSITDIDKLMNNEKIDMIFTDPPYGMGLDTDYSSLNWGDRKGKKYEQGIVDDFNPEMINTILSLNVKETFLWGADYFSEYLINKNDGSWIVWDKTLASNGDAGSNSEFELCWSKQKHKREVIHFNWFRYFGLSQQDAKTRIHPTQKPLQVITPFLEKYSDEDNNILDLFGGSGSTLIACEQLNRKCYMMELDPKYIDVIIERWEQYTGKKAEKVN